MSETITVGEALVRLLEAHGVEVVFGIPGVHTAELYRGLATSKIRHVTPRHEQGAGFMADGYARVTGKPGVAFVITGPGLTNTITAMAQARADSVPMLVISGVNARRTLGKGEGCLHELPDQQALMKSFAKASVTLMNGADLARELARCLALTTSGRPGPVHLEIPTDVMVETIAPPAPVVSHDAAAVADETALEKAAALINGAKAPVILAGGGACRADAALTAFAARIDAPVVLTANARGLMAGHALQVPASASLEPVRALIAASDLVIAVGTEIGRTDYDVYVDGGFPALKKLIRIDVDHERIAAGAQTAGAIVGDSAAMLEALLRRIDARRVKGAERAAETRKAAWNALSDKIRGEVTLLHRLRDAVPGARFIGDSTQLVYAANLYFDAAAPKRWFNSATGYGALGYVPPGAIGAAIAEPDRPVIAVVGDGGLQFSLSELGTAADEKADIVFLVWNNHGYREIETYMEEAGVMPEGVRPTPPDMEKIAAAYGLGFSTTADEDALVGAIAVAVDRGGPHLVEFRAD
ncbi:5-guanidino-2-oxopentanoate decarboxylase [Martelella lutilitoris]|uniref:5-guanidino-2-oxopentanoate decarboxylase n=1 Tax=Martelella lutilitoris TaxID=2583532 RepID=A0A7T7HKS0_9HYPH|nr:5-guanidino-2-oxopentanoate decarboxylase [Martelella lutilitoris]QQM31016.1 5-guanidino-2-oxopentanoate decarboxylase [Martelella lutilitoris]